MRAPQPSVGGQQVVRARRWVLPLLAVVATLLHAGPAGAAGSEPVLVVSGRGFGHGVGMAQDGAYWMGRGGASLDQIIGQFYPGVAIGRGRGRCGSPC